MTLLVITNITRHRRLESSGATGANGATGAAGCTDTPRPLPIRRKEPSHTFRWSSPRRCDPPVATGAAHMQLAASGIAL